MKINATLFFLLLLCFLKSEAQNSLSIPIILDWQFKSTTDKHWLPATVPGTVHTDLLSNKKIQKPYYADNEKRLQWIENKNWEYQTVFDCNPVLMTQNHIELLFEGLDTYADVYLNDKLILKADNMFRSWTVDVKKIIHAKGNVLHIIFKSAVKRGKAEAKKLTYTLPGDEKVFTRKAQYQFGWDFAPRFVTCGIWRKIYLNGWNNIKTDRISFQTQKIQNDSAFLLASFKIKSDAENKITITITNEEQGSKTSKKYIKKLHPGENSFDFPYIVKHPTLWWCNGQGEQHLTHFSVEITNDIGFFTTENFGVGIRSIQLIQDPDKDGTSFYFKLNDKPVFMKGANFIPPDMFLPKVKPFKYDTILGSAADAHMNMIRVWGGGVYENDYFYNLCDKYGLLVWQDFMFACAMYPGDSLFTENVKQEIAENVQRLQSHPCIALWCGNNEIEEGWANWEWQSKYKYSEADSLKIWNDYNNLFHKTIPQVLKECSTSIPYYASSPQIGWGHKESLKQGDCHYWGVWWGMEKYEIYNKKVGRFMTEYGMQSMPELSTIKKYAADTSLSLTSVAVRNHQKHPTGFENLNSYLKMYHYSSPTFEDYIKNTQKLQADAMRTAIEAHLKAQPRCMGTMFWQLNDCWPGTSWSAMDYYNNWKPVMYEVQKLYGEAK